MSIQSLPDGHALENLRTTGTYVVVSPSDGPTGSGSCIVEVRSAAFRGKRKSVQVLRDVLTGFEFQRVWADTGWTVWRVRSLDGRRGGLQPPVFRHYAETGVWNKPENLIYIEVLCVGPGAGTLDVTGVTSQRAVGCSGGCGTVAFKTIQEADLNVSEIVTVGARGNTTDTAGGTTSFGAHVTAPGGAAVSATLAAGTTPATTTDPAQAAAASGADWSIRGGLPSKGVRVSASQAHSGTGACANLLGGVGGAGSATNSFAFGTSGSDANSGASGATANDTNVRLGALGGAGLVLVMEYY